MTTAEPPSRSTLEPVIILPEILDIRAAVPLAAELTGRTNVELDASAVRKLGGQCLQILLSSRAGCALADGHFQITSPSVDFIETATLLGAPFIL